MERPHLTACLTQTLTLQNWHWLVGCNWVQQEANIPKWFQLIKDRVKYDLVNLLDYLLPNHNCWMKLIVTVCPVAWLCPSLCDPMDCRPPGSSFHGIFQARTLKWVSIPLSRGSAGSRDQICLSCIGKRILYHWDTWEVLKLLRSLKKKKKKKKIKLIIKEARTHL